jgi:hypothetical protein
MKYKSYRFEIDRMIRSDYEVGQTLEQSLQDVMVEVIKIVRPELDTAILILLCQIKILASDHVGTYNVMC